MGSWKFVIYFTPLSSSRPFQHGVDQFSIAFRLDNLFNRKITFKASDRGCSRGRTKLALFIFSFFLFEVDFDDESIGDGLQAQKILLLSDLSVDI